MDQLALRETPAQREVWKRKILELQEDARSVRRRAEHFDRMVNSNLRQQRERDELLSRRRRTGSQQKTAEEWDLNNLADESKSLAQSRNMVGDLIDSGQASLTSLVEQRGRLRGVKGILMNVSDKLGLTNSTMRIIERRDVTDAYLVFVGMVVTCIVIYFCYFHFE
mmetsp:Transcript_18248/g.25710  ORF Transcript_18248/g.25710 Transcript_18248/m.25710 type:complete len:166 (-) Transcript_18248:99-596(-)